LEKEVLENHKLYLERIKFYRSFGYDLEKEREFILNTAMPLKGEILEIGTGKGHFVLALARKGYRCVSVDVSAEAQDVARLNLRYFGLQDVVDLRIEDAEELSFPDSSFDIIFSVNVLHHLENPFAVLDEAIRILRSTGRIILSDFTDKGLEIINNCHSKEGRSHDHFKSRLDETREYLTSKGFVIREPQSEAQKVLIAWRDQLFKT